jgi:hypothetical protein
MGGKYYIKKSSSCLCYSRLLPMKAVWLVPFPRNHFAETQRRRDAGKS